jgi:hypothetical protein
MVAGRRSSRSAGTSAAAAAIASVTAAICTLTHGQPGGVCHFAGAKAAAGSL